MLRRAQTDASNTHYRVSLAKAAQGLGVAGKSMDGHVAPRLWCEGQHQAVFDYVAEDDLVLQVGQPKQFSHDRQPQRSISPTCAIAGYESADASAKRVSVNTEMRASTSHSHLVAREDGIAGPRAVF